MLENVNGRSQLGRRFFKPLLGTTYFVGFNPIHFFVYLLSQFSFSKNLYIMSALSILLLT